MSIREALESARECLQQWARFAPTPYGPASNVPALVVEQIDAALRELDAAKPVEFTYGPLGGGYAVWRSDRRAAIGQFTCVSDETAARIAAELLNQHATPPSAPSQEREELADWLMGYPPLVKAPEYCKRYIRRIAAILRGERDG